MMMIGTNVSANFKEAKIKLKKKRKKFKKKKKREIKNNGIQFFPSV